MERLLHYVWQHRLFPAKPLFTTKGEPIEVIDSGLHNDNAGPDFFNAKIKIGNTLWVGNVELHLRSSDWFKHNHSGNPNYKNVILHVAEEVDADIYRNDGSLMEQMVLKIPDAVRANYDSLLKEDAYPPCYRILPSISNDEVRKWMSVLHTERLQAKAERIYGILERTCGDWEQAFFSTLARGFGFGINSDAFEEWASLIKSSAVGKHRDNVFQVEAFFLGQAGLLQKECLPLAHRDEAFSDGYFEELKKEYAFLSAKFSLSPMDGNRWNFLRLRPQNFPHIRIAQLAFLYNSSKANFSAVIGCKKLEDARLCFEAGVTPYWTTHYSFGVPCRASSKVLRRSSLDLLIINVVAPILFAYGRERMQDEFCERAFRFLEQIPAENNKYIRRWTEVGMMVNNALDTQALLQLRKNYCDKKDCLRCSFGFEYLKGRRQNG